MLKKHFLVKGRVQGVGFRYFTEHQARRLGLVGYVRNLDTGDVEAVAAGSQHQLEAFEHWLRHEGSPASHVISVVVSELSDAQEYSDFRVRY
jgi:acylphosphatase